MIYLIGSSDVAFYKDSESGLNSKITFGTKESVGQTTGELIKTKKCTKRKSICPVAKFACPEFVLVHCDFENKTSYRKFPELSIAQIAKLSMSKLKEANKGPDEKAESKGKVSINVEPQRSPSPTKKLSKGVGEVGTPAGASIDPKPGTYTAQ